MRAIWLFALLVLLAQLSTAQATSQLNGSVTDPSGAAVSGAQITLTEAATGAQRNVTSNASGLYQFLDVAPGNYQLLATASGFATYTVSNVTLVVKLPSTINIKFEPLPAPLGLRGSGRLSHKSGLADFKDWYRKSFGRHTPWGDTDSAALVTAVETALESGSPGRSCRAARSPRSGA